MADEIDLYPNLGEIVGDGDFDIRKWSSPGPVSAAYLGSTALARMLLGPFGSGKTTTGLIGEVFCAMRSPRCLDGVRRYRTLVTRDSYRQLYKTVIPSWQQWFPPKMGFWAGGQDRPAEHRLRFMDDYGPVDFEVQFAAIPEGSIKDWMDGFEPTSIFMNAAPSQPQDVMTYGFGRIGRYPPARLLPRGSKIDKHIGGDANKTDVGHWFYKFCVEEKNGDTDVYDMPGGMHPEAENLYNLNGGRDYYIDMARVNAHRPWWVKINVDNKWGPDRSGTPVYEGYDDPLHCAPTDFDARPDLELCLGLDAGTLNGGRPAAVFFQVPSGPRVKVIAELYAGRCGPSRFFDLLLDLMDQPYLRHAAKNMRAWCDPSAFKGADEESGELTWVQLAEKALGITIQAPESNELHNFRIPTVAFPLTQMLAPGDPMFKLSPRCKLVRGGFNSGYRYKRQDKAAGAVEGNDPEKNDYSHPHDALQHGLTGYFGKSLILNAGRTRRDPEAERAVRASPFSLDFNL